MNTIIKAYKLSTFKRDMALSTALTAGGDLVCQQMQGYKEWDWKQCGILSMWGLFYSGGINVLIYNWYEVVFKNLSLTRGVITKACFDNCIHSPMLYLPCFYVYLGLCAGEAPSVFLGRLKEEWWPSVMSVWALWFPVQMINFSVISPPNRIPFMLSVNFGWNILLSYWASKALAKEKEPSEVALD